MDLMQYISITPIVVVVVLSLTGIIEQHWPHPQTSTGHTFVVLVSDPHSIEPITCVRCSSSQIGNRE